MFFESMLGMSIAGLGIVITLGFLAVVLQLISIRKQPLMVNKTFLSGNRFEFRGDIAFLVYVKKRDFPL